MLATNPSTAPAHTVTGIDRLQRIREYPAVTLITGGGPDHEVAARLRSLARTAHQRLVAEYGANHPTLHHVDAAIDHQLALHPGGADPVAVFVSASHASWTPIHGPAIERVVIDDTFATRDLVNARLRSVHTWTVQLGATSHLYAGSGNTFRHHGGGGFPHAETTDTSRGRQRQQLVEPHRHRDQRLTQQLRALDDLLDPILAEDPRPIIVIGARRRIDTFTTHSRHRASCVDAIPWAGRHLDPVRLGELAGPALEHLAAEQTRRAMAEVSGAIKKARLTTGLHNCWQATVAGLADLLVVEESYQAAGRLDPTTAAVELSDDREAPDVVDDLVDDLIETVLARRGRVAIVPDHTLGDLGPLAICTRA
jgi:hypothetical protein